MKADYPEKKSDDDRALKNEPAGENEEEETEKLEHRRGSFAETPASIRETPTASPLRFYARLRYDLEARGIDMDALPVLTPVGGAPPCFRHSGTPYDTWLAGASMLGALVPYRYDAPAEPNYCWDCTAAHKRKAVAAGVCGFPDTRFEKRRTIVRDDQGKTAEIEVVGISRSKTVALDLRSEYDPEVVAELKQVLCVKG